MHVLIHPVNRPQFALKLPLAATTRTDVKRPGGDVRNTAGSKCESRGVYKHPLKPPDGVLHVRSLSAVPRPRLAIRAILA